ncbi:MAG: ATP-binding protein [Lachnospiraceae bacterium]|nr:ATP-binding protein [Lachnospiraceae bacterium]
MALDNVQFDKIMQQYEQIRMNNRKKYIENQKKLHEEHPDIKEIDDKIVECSIAAGVNALKKENSKLPPDYYMNRVNDLDHQRKVLMEKYGISEEVYNIPCNCKKCGDTGYIGRQPCSCLTRRIIDSLYENSNLGHILEKENFDTFNFDYYDGVTIDDVRTPLTPKENIIKVVNLSKQFISEFGKKDPYISNIIFYGECGVGKTFLTHCIAKELIEKEYSVLYMSAIQFFNVIEGKRFRNEADATQLYKIMQKCDLLIIDDLGTEISNSFTDSELYNIVNIRGIEEKSTIISTNLKLEEIRQRYSERIFSRFIGYYTFMCIIGKDIRSIHVD